MLIHQRQPRIWVDCRPYDGRVRSRHCQGDFDTGAQADTNLGKVGLGRSLFNNSWPQTPGMQEDFAKGSLGSKHQSV